MWRGEAKYAWIHRGCKQLEIKLYSSRLSKVYIYIYYLKLTFSTDVLTPLLFRHLIFNLLQNIWKSIWNKGTIVWVFFYKVWFWVSHLLKTPFRGWFYFFNVSFNIFLKFGLAFGPKHHKNIYYKIKKFKFTNKHETGAAYIQAQNFLIFMLDMQMKSRAYFFLACMRPGRFCKELFTIESTGESEEN